MFNIKKNFIIDEKNEEPVAVIIPFNEFKKIEEILENYGLAKLIEDVDNEDTLTYEEAINYYESLKNVENWIYKNLS